MLIVFFRIRATDVLKTSTANLHKSAESTLFIQDLLRCKASEEEYLSYLRSMFIIHAGFEQVISNSEHGVLKAKFKLNEK